jgi:hypothetical protein
MIPDANGLIREWLREQASIVAFTDERQYFKMPEKDKPTLPAIVLVRTGGPCSDEIDYPRMSFSCWAINKHDAGRLAYELATVLDLSTRSQPLALASGRVMSVYDVIAPIDIEGINYAKAMRVQASFMTQAL